MSTDKEELIERMVLIDKQIIHDIFESNYVVDELTLNMDKHGMLYLHYAKKRSG
ncbi:MAG: hypothetical protein WC998_03430 [Candidatus Paceibacterota bacterium]|jgi:hypothetical protein